MQKTIVRKNLILRLAVPRFFVQGDEVVISALVHNYLADGEDRARLAGGEGPGRAGRRDPRRAASPAAAKSRLDWRVRAQQVRTAVRHRQGAHR